MSNDGKNGRLRYIEAKRVEVPDSHVKRLEVRTSGGERLGKLDGLIVDPATRRVCSFVIADHGLFRSRRYLVPLCPAQLDPEHDLLRVEAEPSERTEFDPTAFETFSDDDVLTALFHRSDAA